LTLGQPAAAGYWTADFLIQALKKAGPDLSREALYNAINGGFTYDYDGGGGIPVTWPLAHHYLQVGPGTSGPTAPASSAREARHRAALDPEPVLQGVPRPARGPALARRGRVH